MSSKHSHPDHDKHDEKKHDQHSAGVASSHDSHDSHDASVETAHGSHDSHGADASHDDHDSSHSDSHSGGHDSHDSHGSSHGSSHDSSHGHDDHHAAPAIPKEPLKLNFSFIKFPIAKESWYFLLPLFALVGIFWNRDMSMPLLVTVMAIFYVLFHFLDLEGGKKQSEAEEDAHPVFAPATADVPLVDTLIGLVKIPVAKESWLFVAPLFALMIVFWGLGHTTAFSYTGLAAGYVIFFFRDMDRKIVRDASKILAPADGRIISITKVQEKEFLNEECFRVSIFMSLIDNHINRLPVKGKILHQKHKDGEWLPADSDDASERNEKNGIGVESEKGNIYFEQVAGLIARRIVSKVEINDTLEQGDRFGLIMFGSRVDLYLPAKNITIEVKKGKHVYGGLTVIGKYND